MAFKRSGVRFPSSPQTPETDGIGTGSSFAGDGRPPLILISDGAIDPVVDWEYQLPAFSVEFDCVLFDPGRLAPPRTLDGAATQLSDLIRAAPGPCFLLAHGKGCLPAIQSARDNPSAVRALAFVSPICRSSPDRLERAFLRLPWLVRPFLRRRLANTHTVPREAVRLDQPAAEFFDDVQEKDLCADLRLIQQPVALLHGDLHQAGPDQVEQMNDDLPRSRLIRFAHLGNSPHRAEGDHVNAILVDFFLSQEGRLERMLRTVMRGIGRLFGSDGADRSGRYPTSGTSAE